MRNSDSQKYQPRVDLKRMRMLDFLLIVAILLGSAGWLLASRTDTNLDNPDPREVVVFHDGVASKRLGLGTDTTVTLLHGKMTVEIHDHRIRIQHSDCPRQFCVHQGWAKYEGESIICVPFKTLIEIQSSAGPVLDAVVY